MLSKSFKFFYNSLIYILSVFNRFGLSIFKIIFYEIFFILRGFKGNKVNFFLFDEITQNIPCPYYFLVKIKNYLKDKKITTFIDLGCGSGRVIFFLNKYFKIKYFGVEFYDKPYNYCVSLFSKHKNIQITNEDFRNLNFLKEEVDCFFLNEPLKSNKDFEFVIYSILEKYRKIDKRYFIILVNVTNEHLSYLSSIFLVDHKIINNRGYYIYSNVENPPK